MLFTAEEIEEIKIIVRSVLTPDEIQKVWVSGQEAANALGITIGRLRQARLSGQLKPGTDFRSANYGEAAPQGLRWEYHLENCRKRLDNLSDQRKSKLKQK